MFEVSINLILSQSVTLNPFTIILTKSIVSFVSMRIVSSSSTVLLVRYSSSIISAVDEIIGPVSGDCRTHCFLILNNKTEQSSKRLGNRRVS